MVWLLRRSGGLFRLLVSISHVVGIGRCPQYILDDIREDESARNIYLFDARDDICPCWANIEQQNTFLLRNGVF